MVICAGGTRSSATYQKAWQQLGVDPSGNVDFDQFELAVGESTLDVLRKRHASSNDPDGWKDLTRHLAKMWMTPLEYGIEDFARIRGPVLMMLGDRDQFITVEENVELYRSLQSAQLAVIPGSDHGVPFSEFELCTGIMLAFLQGHR